MKKFNIARYHYLVNGLHLPINCVYGTFPTTTKYYTGKKTIFTKKGKIFIRKLYNEVHEDITYYCDNFKPYKVLESGKERLAYKIHVWDNTREKWIATNTEYLKKYHALGVFLADMFEKNDIKSTTKCVYWIDGLKDVTPKDKKAQVHSDSVYKVPIGYALSKNVMTCHNINRDGWNYEEPAKPRKMSL